MPRDPYQHSALNSAHSGELSETKNARCHGRKTAPRAANFYFDDALSRGLGTFVQTAVGALDINASNTRNKSQTLRNT